jgi:hypothetical protein
MKTFNILLLVTSPSLFAYDTYIEPTIPGTTLKDFDRPGFVRQGDNVYQTIPGTTLRDWDAPGYRIQRH